MFMAPMTRSRALPGGVPSDLAIEYYGQRASAGLIITEGTAPAATGIGYARTPSIDTPEQVAAWKRITDAVHARRGRIFTQFMHVGRIAHSANRYVSDQCNASAAPGLEFQTDPYHSFTRCLGSIGLHLDYSMRGFCNNPSCSPTIPR